MSEVCSFGWQQWLFMPGVELPGAFTNDLISSKKKEECGQTEDRDSVYWPTPCHSCHTLHLTCALCSSNETCTDSLVVCSLDCRRRKSQFQFWRLPGCHQFKLSFKSKHICWRELQGLRLLSCMWRILVQSPVPLMNVPFLIPSSATGRDP